MKKQNKPKPVYSLMDEMMASPTAPLSVARQEYQLLRMFRGLQAIQSGEKPSNDDWSVCCDAANLMETLVVQGVVADPAGLTADSIAALEAAGKRQATSGAIRLDGAGIQAMHAILIDYTTVLESVPARTIIRCHRATEKRLHEIHAGKRQPHDVFVHNAARAAN